MPATDGKIGRRVVWLLLAMTLGCSTTATDSDPDPDTLSCPIPTGEFGPIGCAIVRGVAWQNGQRLVEKPIRGDGCSGPSFVGPYGSSTVRTDHTGAFTLTLSWIEPLSSPRRIPPDTATVELRTFGQPNPRVCASPSGRAFVVARFAENGKVVAETRVDSLVFDPIE